MFARLSRKLEVEIYAVDLLLQQSTVKAHVQIHHFALLIE
jgi:hypothetical protein